MDKNGYHNIKCGTISEMSDKKLITINYQEETQTKTDNKPTTINYQEETQTETYNKLTTTNSYKKTPIDFKSTVSLFSFAAQEVFSYSLSSILTPDKSLFPQILAKELISAAISYGNNNYENFNFYFTCTTLLGFTGLALTNHLTPTLISIISISVFSNTINYALDGTYQNYQNDITSSSSFYEALFNIATTAITKYTLGGYIPEVNPSVEGVFYTELTDPITNRLTRTFFAKNDPFMKFQKNQMIRYTNIIREDQDEFTSNLIKKLCHFSYENVIISTVKNLFNTLIKEHTSMFDSVDSKLDNSDHLAGDNDANYDDN